MNAGLGRGPSFGSTADAKRRTQDESTQPSKAQQADLDERQVGIAPDISGEIAPCETSDQRRVAEIFASEAGRVYRSLHYLGVASSAIDDAVQDVFIVVMRRLHTYRPEASLRAWVLAITTRVAADHRKRARRYRDRFVTGELDAPVDALAGLGFDVETRTIDKQALDMVLEILDGLNNKQRRAFVLMEIEQLTLKEAAAALGTNISTVNSRLQSAHKALQKALKRRALLQPGSLSPPEGAR